MVLKALEKSQNMPHSTSRGPVQQVDDHIVHRGAKSISKRLNSLEWGGSQGQSSPYSSSGKRSGPVAGFPGVGWLGDQNHTWCLPQSWNLLQVKAQVEHVQNRIAKLVCIFSLAVGGWFHQALQPSWPLVSPAWCKVRGGRERVSTCAGQMPVTVEGGVEWGWGGAEVRTAVGTLLA